MDRLREVFGESDGTRVLPQLGARAYRVNLGADATGYTGTPLTPPVLIYRTLGDFSSSYPSDSPFFFSNIDLSQALYGSVDIFRPHERCAC